MGSHCTPDHPGRRRLPERRIRPAPGHRLGCLLERKLASEALVAKVVNASISGDTTSGGQSRLAGLLKAHQPTHVVIELGGNDALRGLPLQLTRDNLDKMTRAAQTPVPRCCWWACRCRPTTAPTMRAVSRRCSPRVARERKAALVPFLLKGVADGPDALRLFQPDRIHPREEAHPIMLANV
jgi:acyl-CoA thioesterase-1